MRKLMLNFCHFWIHNLMRVKVTRVVSPITVIASGLDLSLAVVPGLASGVLVNGQAWATSHHSAAAGKFAVCGDESWLWKLNGVDAGGMERRVTRPSWFDVSFGDGLGNQLQVITQTYWFGTKLGLFANQLMVPDNVNMASHASPKLNPSPNDCHP